MQQGGSQYGMSPEMTRTQHILGVSTSDQLQQQQQQLLHQQRSSDTTAAVVAEGASPISSRAPPVGARSSGNLDELVAVSSGGFPDDDGIGGDEMERGVLSGGNRWPRQETIALLKIRSEMDAAFRDATLKGPLWDDVSRKLAELGYVRSAKKCKEKFENVHKYYKRTKEGRAGRQDGKSYRFFSQLEALHTTTTTTTTATTTTTTPVPPAVVPVSMGIGTVIATTGRIQPNSETATPNAPMTQIGLPRMNPLDLSGGVQIGVSGSASAAVGSAFSSDTSSDYSDSDDELEGEPSNTNTRKRKRGESSSNRKMMGFFEGLMKQVIERQEAMQQRFLEMIEKRDQDRMIREEAWKHQEMVRLNREHEIIAHEREISATRDAAIIAFLQKITGQSIQLPPSVAIPPTAPPQSTPPPPPPPQPQQQHYQQQQKKEIIRHQPTTTELVVAAIPEQQHPPPEMGGGGGGSLDQSSSRWPKAEVLALISLRSGLDSRYQDAGPKGPLWEEISGGMHRMGYNRSSKRCKEKWENINKYFKKVKESNKKRPEDAKTCPYFHQLDDLYRKKMLGGVGSSSFVNQNNEQQQLDSSTNDSNPTANLQVIMAPPPPPPPETNEAENKNIDDINGGSIEVKKPEDIMMEHHPQHSVMDFYEKLEEPNRDNRDHEEENEEEEVMEDDEEETEEEEEERKMGYKIQFQRPNAGSSNGGGNTGGSPFMAMVK